MLKFLVLSDLHINSNDAITNTAGFTNLDTSRILERVKALYKEHILIVSGSL
jgi:metallophosphoesterase superfamily enzyme